MSDADHALRASADFFAETHQYSQAIGEYQEIQKKLMAWNLDLDNDLRDAVCISRTWVALGEVLRQAGRADEAAELEARTSALLEHWTQKLPNNPRDIREAFLPHIDQPH
jgi:hypothetical protein